MFNISPFPIRCRLLGGPVRSGVTVRSAIHTLPTTLLAAAILFGGQGPAASAQAPTAESAETPAMIELREARRLAQSDPRLGVPRLIRALGEIGAWHQAERFARPLLETEPNAEHALLLALTLRRQDQLDAAIAVLERQLDRDDTAAGETLRRELALLYLADGLPSRALELVEQAAKPDPGVRGLTLAALPERNEDAAGALRYALEHPDQTVVPERELVHELGTVLLESGEPGAALVHLRSAAEAAPEDPDTAYRLALALRALGRSEEARDALERFQTLREAADRRDAERRALGARLNEAQELAQQNRLDEALARVDEILDAYPDSYSALALRAKIRFSMGRTEGATLDIRRAARLEPGVTEFHYLEGLFERTAGNAGAARDALRRALALDPGLSEAHALLGGIELDLGNPTAALEHLETAVELGATGEQIDRAIEIARRRSGADP